MANLLDELHLGPDSEAYDESAKRRAPSITDYLRALGIGLIGDTARGGGELLEKGGIDYGRRMREAGDFLEQQQLEEMTPGGRRAFTEPVFTDDKDSFVGLTPNPHGAWGPATMQAARSLPQMAMMAAPAAPAAGALRAIPAVARAIESGGVAGKAADFATTGLPFGAAEGVQAALTNAAQTRSEIQGMKHDDLLRSPEYQDIYAKTSTDLSESDRQKLARDELAARAASDVFNRTLPWTGGIGAFTGGGAPGAVMRGGVRRGAFDFAKEVGKTAGAEALQEAPQSAGEQYIQNLATARAKPEQDPMEGVLSSAAGGAAVGALTGAPIGGVHALTARGATGSEPSAVDRLTDIARSLAARATPATATPAATPAPAPASPGAPAPRVDVQAAAKATQAAQAAAMAPTSDDPVQALQALPEGEREAITKDFPKMDLGAETQFQIPGSNQQIGGRFALAEADSLVASHNPALQENPAYPKSLQPRDRTAAGYELQVGQMAQNLQPAMLGASPSATDGAPIVGPDGVVESGNGRWIALQRRYAQDGAKDYRAWLEQNAAGFGLTPEQVKAMKKPVLVRERTTPVNRAEFARAANAPTVAQMGPLDQARADAQRMGDLSGLAVGEDGNLFVPQNQKVVRGFFTRLPITEQTGLVDRDGRISQAGQRRFLNAVIVRAYGEHSPAVMRLVESVNPDLRGLLGALTKIAPMVAKARDAIAAKNMADRDLTGLIVGAVDELMRLKAEGKSVADELAQAQMFTHLPDGTAEVLTFLDANARNPAKISQFVMNYLGELARYGQPGQNDMFGAPPVPGAPDLVRRAKEMTGEETPGSVQPGAQPGASAAAGPAAGGQPAGPEGPVANAGAGAGAPEAGQPAGGAPSPAEVEAKAAAVKESVLGGKPAQPAAAPAKPSEEMQASPSQPVEGEKETTAASSEEEPQSPGEAASAIDEAAHKAATSPKNELPEPTEPQKEAGNYQKGHLKVGPLDVSVENPAGSKRRPEWPTLTAHYGYVKGVAARSPDKEHVDVFVKPGTSENYSGPVFSIWQNKADGTPDESKNMIGWEDELGARAAYLHNYSKGWDKRIRSITQYSMDEFNAKLQDAGAFLKPPEGASAKPAAEGGLPKPNENGVYDHDQARVVTFTGDKKVDAKIYTLEIAPGKWIEAPSVYHKQGDFNGYSSPLSAHDVYPDEATALGAAALSVIRRETNGLKPGLSGSEIPAQKVAQKKLIEWADQYVPDDEFAKAYWPKHAPEGLLELYLDWRQSKAKGDLFKSNNRLIDEVASKVNHSIDEVSADGDRYTIRVVSVRNIEGERVYSAQVERKDKYGGGKTTVAEKNWPEAVAARAKEMLESARTGVPETAIKKGGTNAGQVRGDQGQAQGKGSERPSGEAGGGEDLQRPAEAGAETGNEKREAPPVGAYTQLGTWVREQLAAGKSFSNEELNAEAAKAFGGTAATGAFSPRDAFDAMEMGVNLLIRSRAADFTPIKNLTAANVALNDLRALMAKLPTQAKRTNEQIEYQQFSTPPTLAYLANWVASPRSGETVLEPSAGTGDLATFAKIAGAKVVANEITPRRADILKELGFKVTREDAEQIDNLLPDDVKPTLVLMNPPFSSAGGRVEGQRNIENGIRHLDQAWARLEPGGRMVALMGENFGGPAASRRWLAKVREAGEVRAIVKVEGKEYAKYGTSYGTALMVLDKTGKPQAGTTVTGDFQTVNDALKALEGVRNERSQPETTASVPEGEREPVEQAGAETREEVRGEAEPAGTARAEPGAAPSGQAAPAEPKAARPAPGEEVAGQVSLPLEPGQPGTGERGARSGSAVGREPQAAGVRGQPAAKPGVAGAASGESASGVTLEKQETQQSAVTGGVFEAYTPAKVKIAGAKPHVSSLVESAAMASVLPPDPTYTPNLPESTVKGGKLSDAQLEAVVYAGQSHQSFLPDGSRRGFFIGDGTGVGKGREISAIIMDNLRQGRDKAVWVSEKQGLIRDAQRDMGDAGGPASAIFPQSKSKASEAIERKSGILFTTYSTLRSSEKRSANEDDKTLAKTRTKQVADWLGPDFEGVIVFDEAHNMQSAMEQKAKRGKKGASQQALAGLELQRLVPKARVVYSSATGATSVANLAYAQRLGLWGEQTAFATVDKFVSAIHSAGVSAMELVARDLKQAGMYIARSLSFSGVTYERVTHELTPLQRAMYDRMAEGWQVVLQNINEALALTGADGSGAAKSAAYSKFWGAQQRFFNQVITSMQMPTVLEDIDKDLARGDAVVLQIVNTMEAELDRKLALVEEDADLQDLDLTPRDALIQMVMKAFPVQEFHMVVKDGAEVSVPVVDSDGNPVLSKQAIAMRESLIKDLQDIRVPEAPLDMILKKFGTERVAEVTGRSTRIIPSKDEEGRPKVIQEHRTATSARADADAFMDDKKDILIFSDAGGTGYSFHADRTKENQRRRQHYLIQPGWRADKAVQGFGRTHRSNEASQPNYKLAETNLKAQKRFISSVARRLDQLGALTKGQRSASGQQLFDEKDNLEGVYASRAIRQLIYDSFYGKESRVPFAEMIEGQMGLNIRNDETGGLAENRIPDVPQFLNRMLSLTIKAQDQVFDAFFDRMESLIEIAKQNNELDVGVQDLGATEVSKLDEQTVYTDERTGAETKLVRLEAQYPREFTSWEEASSMFDALERDKKADYGIEGYWIGKGEHTMGRPFVVYRYGTETQDNGSVTLKYRSLSPMGKNYDIAAYVSPDVGVKANRAEVEKLWDAYIKKQPPTFRRIENLLTGAILPVWDRMHGQFVRVVQTSTKDGERLLGRWISPHSLEATLKAFGMSQVAKMTPEQIRAAVMDENKQVVLANGWTLKRTRKAGENRLEVVADAGYGNASRAELVRYGAFTEVDGWKERTYLPVDDLGALERMLKVRPAADIISGRAAEPDAKYEVNAGEYFLVNKDTRAVVAGPFASREAANRAIGENTQDEVVKGSQLSAEQPRKRPEGEIRDLFAIDQSKDGSGPIETVVVTPVRKGTLHIGFDKIDTPEKAAHAFANLRKHPREYFNMLMLDKNDRPVAAAELFSGTVNQTSVYPREIAALAYQTPGVKKLWIAHNHPSGVAEPSHADELLTRSIGMSFGKNLGVELMGHVIIAGTKANAFYVAKPPPTKIELNLPYFLPYIEKLAEKYPQIKAAVDTWQEGKAGYPPTGKMIRGLLHDYGDVFTPEEFRTIRTQADVAQGKITQPSGEHPMQGVKFDIPPASRKFEVPLLERMVTKSVGGPKTVLSSPTASRDFLRNMSPGQDGIVWLDAQHRAVGWQPMTFKQMEKAGGSGVKTGAADLFKRIGRNNPVAAIVYVQSVGEGIADEPTLQKIRLGLMGFKSRLSLVDIQLLDGIVQSDSGMVSLAERGLTDVEPPKYSVGPRGARAGALSAGQVQAVLDSVMEQWPNAPAMRAVESEEELPDRVRTDAAANGQTGRVEAVIDPYSGMMYFVAARMGTPEKIQWTVLHEVMGHYGMRGAFGKDLDAALQYLWNANPKVREKTAAASQRWGYSLEDRKFDAIEEAVSELAAEGFHLNGLRTFFARVQTWLRTHGMGALADWLEGLTDAELTTVLTMSRRYVIDGGDMHFSGDVAMSTTGPTWFSALRRHVDGMNVNNAAPEHWQRELESAVKSGKVKRDEIEWSGLREWLETQTGKVAKGDVTDFLAQNGVQVTETLLGGVGKTEKTSTVDQLVVELDALGYDIITEQSITGDQLPAMLRRRSDGQEFDVTFDGIIASEQPDVLGVNDLPEDAVTPARHLMTAMAIEESGVDVDGTRHSRWTLPGGKNYRELLLTLPPKTKNWEVFNPKDGVRVASFDSEAEAMADAERRGAQFDWGLRDDQDSPHNFFTTTHWSQPNILAHIRFNERTDAEGKRVLFIEEIQSDWAQKGKREGFGQVEEWKAIRNGVTTMHRSEEEARRLAAATPGGYVLPVSYTKGIPSAPFVTKTESWVALALKRMIRYAAENGFDRVAWTTGDQQNERYSLENHLRSLYYEPPPENGMRTAYVLTGADELTGRTVNLGAHEPDELASVVGEEIAKRMERREGRKIGGTGNRTAFEGSYELSGLDLHVGGEGMRAFYDKIVPNVANDVLKKLGGGRVVDVVMGGRAATEEGIGGQVQPGFDVTPELRESVMRGVPLFAVAQGDRPVPPGARRFSTYSEDSAGRPLLAGEFVSIVDPQFYEERLGAQVFNHQILAGDRVVGVAMLGWKDGGIQDLYYISTFPKMQKLGVAEDAVRAMLNHNSGRPIRANLVLAQARGFWEKMGATFVDTEEGEDGYLTIESYNASKAAREGQGGAGEAAQGKLREAAVGEGEAGPDAAPGTEALRDLDFTSPKFSVADPAVSDQERADALLAQQSASVRPLEALFKGVTEATRIPKLTGALYDKLVSAVQNVLPENAKAGLIDKYGVPEYVQDRFAETIGRERQQLRQAGNMIDRMPLTREQSRVAYQWLNQNAEGGDTMLEGLPAESQEVLREWKAWAHQMQGEAVRLGQLDADTAERNEYAYTHRSYLKYETDQGKKAGAGAIRILGDQYRTRGLTDEIDTEQLAKWNPQWWERVRGKEDVGLKGRMFLKLEKRVNSKEGMAVLPGVEEAEDRGKVTRRIYWPADQEVPARYADYDIEGTWEARWVDGKNVTLWRDYTPEERRAMGEIDEARYAVTKTSQLMIHDIEVGKLLEWLANHEARPEAPREAEIVNANESLRQAYRPGTWVKVPEATAPGTKVAKYGKLAGLYIPGPIWNEVRQVVNQRYKPLGETYDQLLRLWKVSKTAMSPAVHMNNIMANVVMAEWQDLTAAHMAKALRVISKPEDPVNKIVLDRFEDAGGSVGMWTLSEIQKSQLEPLLTKLEREAAGDNPEAIVNAGSVIQALQAGRYREAADMVSRTGPTRATKAVLDKMVEIYQGEDQIFRLAAFLKAKEEGQSDTAAGKFARESFLDYHITAPWINIMRSTAFPFVAFTYRALPLLAETLAKKPWKMLKLATIAGALNTIGYVLSGGDEDRERKLLPEEKSGVIWGYNGNLPFSEIEVNLGVSPKLVRMPWNDQFDSPVFLDVRRFVPLGDIVDVGQVHSAVPLLPTMMPGGPLALLAELVANRSFFTGKDIIKDTDTPAERTKKLGAYVYQWAMPNIPLVPGSYSFASIQGTLSGETDVFGRERSPAQAAASAAGIRLASYPQDLGQQSIIRQLGQERREIGENVSALRRQFQRGALDRDEFESKIREQLEKRQQFEKEARRRLSGE